MIAPSPKPPEFRAVFFSKKTIWLAPNDLVRFQLHQKLLACSGWGHWVTTFSSLEGLLAAELDLPEVEGLIRSFILNDLAAPLAELLWPQGAGQPGRAEIKTLAEELADGLDRLKLAGLSWEQVAALPPPELARPLADLGRHYDRLLAGLGRADRAGRRRLVLEGLRSGRAFKTLEGTEEIVCRWSRRLSPFETDFIMALAHGRQLRITLHAPAWVRDEFFSQSQGHAAGFDLLRSIRQLEQCEEPGLWLDFAEAADGPAPPALAFAAEALLAPPAYRKRPPELDNCLRIVRAASAYAEVEEAARRLKGLLKESPAHELALVVPNMDSYGPLIDDVGRRFGLHFHFRRGETLADQGPARAVLELIALWSSAWERSRLLSLLKKPYFRLSGLTAGALGRLFLEAGITDNRAGGGFEENLGKMAEDRSRPGRAEAARQLLRTITQLQRAGARLNSAPDWATFIRAFKQLLHDLGWPGDPAAESPEVARLDLAATEAFREELDRLAQALASPQAPAVGLPSFALWLKAVLEERRVNVQSHPEGKIRVLNYYDLHGGLFDEIFFLGLNERTFPHVGSESRWWPEEFTRGAASVLGRPLWNEAADSYGQQEQMLADGLAQARKRVWLFHHAGDEAGRAALPSPLLAAVKELWPDGQGGSLVPEEEAPWLPVRPLAQAAGEDEMWSALMGLAPDQWPWGWRQRAELTAAWEELRRRRELWEKSRNVASPGEERMAEYLAKIPTRVRGERQGPLVRPAFLGALAECPFKFWLSEVLKLRADREPLEEWPTAEEGTLLHAVLEKFFRARLGPEGAPGAPWPGEADFESCCGELLALLDAELESLAATAPLGRLPLWQIRRERLPGFLSGWLGREFEEREGDEPRPWLLEWKFGEDDVQEHASVGPAWELPLSEREAIFFKGRVDRLDRVGEVLAVRDYKRGAPPKAFDKEETPPRLWPVRIYAQAAAAAFGRQAVPVIETLDPTAKKHRLRGPIATPEANTDDNFPAQLTAAWQRLTSGSFPPEGEEEACRYCAFTLLCPKTSNA